MHIPTPSEIRAKRIMIGLKQADVAERAGISQSMVARIEAGSVDPRMSTLRKIIEILQNAEKSRIRAENIMHFPVISVQPNDSVATAVRMMEKNGISQLPVIEDGIPVGCISESAIISAMEENRLQKTQSHAVRDVMEDGFPTIPPSLDVDTIVHLLHGHHAILVVEQGKVKGVITKHNLISLIV